MYRANLLNVRRRRELNLVAGQLSTELGLAYAETKSSHHVERVYQGPVDLVSGKFAPIAKSREFTLVLWRPVLERSLVKSVAGIVCGKSNSWTLECQSNGPGIS